MANELGIKHYDYATGQTVAYARTTDPDTSYNAAECVRPGITKIQSQVLNHFNFVKRSTDEALEKQFQAAYSPSTVRTRRAELVAMGLIKDSGRRTLNSRAHKVIIWEVVQNVD